MVDFLNDNTVEISGSRGGEFKDDSFLRHWDMQYRRSKAMFQRFLMPSASSPWRW